MRTRERVSRSTSCVCRIRSSGLTSNIPLASSSSAWFTCVLCASFSGASDIDVPDLSLREMRIEKYLRTLRTEAQQRFVAISLNELYFMHRLLPRVPCGTRPPRGRTEKAAA